MSCGHNIMGGLNGHFIHNDLKRKFAFFFLLLYSSIVYLVLELFNPLKPKVPLFNCRSEGKENCKKLVLFREFCKTI